jgi:hypothetical protein
MVCHLVQPPRYVNVNLHLHNCQVGFWRVGINILHGQKTLAPQQERSRESLRKLQKATAEVLGQHGVEGATIPRIAQHAGLTPGAIYRRFHDKDALLEATILGMMERQEERMKSGLTPATAAQIPLPVLPIRSSAAWW